MHAVLSGGILTGSRRGLKRCQLGQTLSPPAAVYGEGHATQTNRLECKVSVSKSQAASPSLSSCWVYSSPPVVLSVHTTPVAYTAVV